MLTLNQVITILNNKQKNHAQLSNGTFIINDPWEYGSEFDIKYPLMGVNTMPFSITGNMAKFSFVIYFCDLQHKDTSNEWELKSDMYQIALDIISQVRYELQNVYGCVFDASINLKDFEERFDDEVTGWECEFSFDQYYDHSTCDLPDSLAYAGYVSIIDKDTNAVLYRIPPAGTYTVEQLKDIIDTITGNTVTIIDPLT